MLKISSPYGRILLTGDIEKQAEATLLQTNKNLLHADIMLVAHHGSRSSSSQAFIDAVNPQTAVISSGFKNRYRFPAEAVVKRFEARQINLFNTADSGALLFKLDASGSLTPIRWRQEAQTLWRAVATD